MTEPAPQSEQGFFPSSIHPGDLTDQLRKCREKAGLDLEQAAEELHLSPHILKALEAEDFAHLPEPPYVRGYLRGYAKLADTDSKELIRIYEALRGTTPDEMVKHFAPVRPLHKVAQQPMLSATTLKFMGFGALVLLLGLLSMIPGVREWASHTWGSFAVQTKSQDSASTRPPSALEVYALQKAEREQEKNRQESLAQQAVATPTPTPTPAVHPEPSAATTTATNAAPTPAAETVVAAASSVTPEPAPATQPPATSDAATTTPPATPATSDVTATPAASTPTTMPTAPASDATAASTAAPAPATQSPAAGDATATPAGEPQPTGTPVTIKMEFSEEVWAQIKSIDKKVLYEALNTPNTIKEFQVVPPVDIKLGNAPGAKVFVNGQPFDTTPHTKGSVARFKVE